MLFDLNRLLQWLAHIIVQPCPRFQLSGDIRWKICYGFQSILKFELDLGILRLWHKSDVLSFDFDGLIKELLVESVILVIILAVGYRETIIPSAVMQLIESSWHSILLSRETAFESNAVALGRALRVQDLI